MNRMRERKERRPLATIKVYYNTYTTTLEKPIDHPSYFLEEQHINVFIGSWDTQTNKLIRRKPLWRKTVLQAATAVIICLIGDRVTSIRRVLLEDVPASYIAAWKVV
jgi:hypothetical protein